MQIRQREGELAASHGSANHELVFHESTYHFSSQEKENNFIQAQYPTPELRRRYDDYRQEWHRRSVEKTAGDTPLAVIIELVSFCNLQCEMCYTRTPEFQEAIIGSQRMLPWETVTRLIDECAELGVCSILFSWRGASALYQSQGTDGKSHDFADALQYARDRGILEVTSLTNGRAMSEKLIEKIVRARPNWISFSVDGLGDAYNRIRCPVPGDKGRPPFDVVFGNLKKMVDVRERLGQALPQIRTNTIFPAIADNPEEYCRVMEEAGVGLVTVNELLDFRGEELPPDAIAKNWFCQYPFQRLVVSANGAVMPCPGAHNEEPSVLLGRYVGSPKKQPGTNRAKRESDCREMTLLEAWQSDRIQEIRTLHRDGQRTTLSACKHCRHGAIPHGAEWVPEDWDMATMTWADKTWRNG